MILIKSIWLALVDVFKLHCNLPKLLIDLFWALIGIVSLVLSLVLFPLIVYRKYKNLKPKKSKKVIRKFGVVRA